MATAAANTAADRVSQDFLGDLRVFSPEPGNIDGLASAVMNDHLHFFRARRTDPAERWIGALCDTRSQCDRDLSETVG
jgi:hypothetical protein